MPYWYSMYKISGTVPIPVKLQRARIVNLSLALAKIMVKVIPIADTAISICRS